MINIGLIFYILFIFILLLITIVASFRQMHKELILLKILWQFFNMVINKSTHYFILFVIEFVDCVDPFLLYRCPIIFGPAWMETFRE